MEGKVGGLVGGAEAAAIDIESFGGGDGEGGDEGEEHSGNQEETSAEGPAADDDGEAGDDFEPSDKVGGIAVIGRKEDLVVEDVFREGVEVAQLDDADDQEEEPKCDTQELEGKNLSRRHGGKLAKTGKRRK